VTGLWTFLHSSLLGVLLVVAAGGATVGCVVATGKGKLAEPAPGPESSPVPPNAYAVAYLKGGRLRAAETAIATLLSRGQLRVTAEGRVAAAGTPPLSPLERAVHTAASGGVAPLSLRNAAEIKPAMQTLETELAQQQLVSRRRPLTTLTYALLALEAVALVVGLAATVYASNLLTLILIPQAGLVAWYCLFVNQRETAIVDGTVVKSLPPTTTGLAMLAQAERQHEAGGRGFGPAEFVALDGLPAYPDRQVAEGLLLR